jgi:transcriptional regulator with XRE-family HTH domain
MTMAASTFGQELRRLRQQRGMSLARFAELISYDASYLSRIENGRRRPTAALAHACDAALRTDGRLSLLVPPRPTKHRATGTRSNAAPRPVCTGWLRPAWDTQEWSIAICGSRAAYTDGVLIDHCVHSIGRLLTRLRCRVSHGPLGIGIEVMTWIADHYRPPGLDCVLGTVGRLNVIRPADYIIVIGGAAGTRDEVHLASSLNKTIIPLPASGGAAIDAFNLLAKTETVPGLHDDVADLGSTADAEDYARIIERILRRKATTTS